MKYFARLNNVAFSACRVDHGKPFRALTGSPRGAQLSNEFGRAGGSFFPYRVVTSRLDRHRKDRPTRQVQADDEAKNIVTCRQGLCPLSDFCEAASTLPPGIP